MRPSRLTLAGFVVAIAACGVLAPVGGGRRLDDRTTRPQLPGSVLEKVADLDFPPGNIAVSRSGRVFFTLHPDGHPPAQVMELKNDVPVPYAPPGTPPYQTVLALRIDAQDRLWALDHAEYARGTPRLLAFDLATDTLVHWTVRRPLLDR